MSVLSVFSALVSHTLIAYCVHPPIESLRIKEWIEKQEQTQSQDNETIG